MKLSTIIRAAVAGILSIEKKYDSYEVRFIRRPVLDVKTGKDWNTVRVLSKDGLVHAALWIDGHDITVSRLYGVSPWHTVFDPSDEGLSISLSVHRHRLPPEAMLAVSVGDLSLVATTTEQRCRMRERAEAEAKIAAEKRKTQMSTSTTEAA